MKKKKVRAGADEDDARSKVDPRYIVPGLSKGLALLRLFSRERPAQTLLELAAGLGLTRSGAYRLVYTLEKDGFIARDDATRTFRLTSRVLSLGFEYLSSLGLTELATPILRRLTDVTSAASHLVILDGWEVLYLARMAPSVALVSNLQVGTRLPAHITASGRVLLSDADDDALADMFRRLRREYRGLPPLSPFEAMRAQAIEDRARGYVYRGSVLDPGLMTFACPIRDSTGRTVAAINVVGPEAAMKAFGGEKALRPIMLDAALTFSGQLGFKGELVLKAPR